MHLLTTIIHIGTFKLSRMKSDLQLCVWSVYLKYFNILVLFQVCNFAFISRDHLYMAGQVTPDVPISILVPHLPGPWNLKCSDPCLTHLLQLHPKNRLSSPLEPGHSQEEHTRRQDSFNTLWQQPEIILTQKPFRPMARLL